MTSTPQREAQAMPDGTVDYHTHILIGVQASGSMTVICHWSHVPRQADVQDQIGKIKEPYATFLLCTPTAILPRGDDAAARYGSFR
jgi:hypothetical protein